MAKPEKIAPATKYGGKMVVCHPGITEVAKSIDTMVCTESTSGVEIPAKINDTASKRCQVFTLPVHPNDKTVYTFFRMPAARSRIVAISGNKPVYQNKRDTEK
ncbi:hypothetical protein D9M68_676860 [compost metagenome]